MALLALAACRSAAPPARVTRVPDPVAPPVPGAPFTESERTASLLAVSAAERGDRVAAKRYSSMLPVKHPVTELVSLECEYLGGRGVLDDVRELAAAHPEFASAWEFLVQLEQEAGDPAAALRAARAVALARPGRESDRLVGASEATLVTAAVSSGEASLVAGEPEAAFTSARAALDLVPEASALRGLAVRAALASERPKAAAELVAALPDTAEATMLKGRVAAALGQWGLAAELYKGVPKDYPGRCAAYLEARERWRLSTAPPYVGRALAAKEVRRRNLAAILAWEAPELNELQDAPVVVFEDVVQLPEQRDIVTVARAGVMQGDTVTRRFGPERLVRPGELKTIIGRLATRLGRTAPGWCSDSSVPGCLALPEALSGSAVANLLRAVAVDPEEPCR